MSQKISRAERCRHQCERGDAFESSGATKERPPDNHYKRERERAHDGVTEALDAGDGCLHTEAKNEEQRDRDDAGPQAKIS